VLEPVGPTVEVDAEAWGRLLEVNLTGAFHCIQAVLPGMLQRGGGGSSTSRRLRRRAWVCHGRAPTR
jgi:NAD(P)-dependent dehydrogenase (short-subunit alcohol dehydrogenase family)